MAFEVVGKSVEEVCPVTKALGGLDVSRAIAIPASKPLPPRYVEYSREAPPAFKTVTNALPLLPVSVVLKAAFVPLVGKLVELVCPTMNALPEESATT